MYSFILTSKDQPCFLRALSLSLDNDDGVFYTSDYDRRQLCVFFNNATFWKIIPTRSNPYMGVFLTNSTSAPPLTSGAINPSLMTSALITTSSITRPITSQEVTTSRQTTALVTTSLLTTQRITSSKITTQHIVTTSPVTTQRITSFHVTTNREVTTSAVTTQGITTSQVTTSVITTQILSTGYSTNSNEMSPSDSERNSSLSTIIAAVIVPTVLLALFGSFLLFAMRRRKQKSKRQVVEVKLSKVTKLSPSVPLLRDIVIKQALDRTVQGLNEIIC